MTFQRQHSHRSAPASRHAGAALAAPARCTGPCRAAFPTGAQAASVQERRHSSASTRLRRAAVLKPAPQRQVVDNKTSLVPQGV